jgi:hypothetical protein
MRQKKSHGVFLISLIMILLLSIFLISWDVLNLEEKLQPEYVFTISRAAKIFIILTAAVSLIGIIWGIIDINKEKGRKLLIRLTG